MSFESQEEKYEGKKRTVISELTCPSIRFESARSLSMTSQTCKAVSPNRSLRISTVRICEGEEDETRRDEDQFDFFENEPWT